MPSPSPRTTVQQLLNDYHVDMAHARRVADLALALYDQTAPLHRLPAKLRPLLEAGALLHNVGLDIDQPRHHLAGRNLVMGVRLADYSAAQKRILACLIRFHRKKVRPDDEPAYLAQSAPARRRTLALASLVRLADGLDYSQSQTTDLTRVEVADTGVTLHIEGPECETDGDRAIEKADLWEDVFGVALRVSTPLPDVASAAAVPLALGLPVIDAARRALADQSLRWQAAQPGLQAGEAAAVKAARAAARRSRAAIDLFSSYIKKRPARQMRRRLKAAEDALAAVRDWDVSLGHLRKFAGEAAPAILVEWEAARQASLEELGSWLPEAEGLTRAMAEFVADLPARQRQADADLQAAAPALLAPAFSELIDCEAAVRYTDLDTYHQLRLAIKRLRFALEFFGEAFGDEARSLLKDLVAFQDRLGTLNDVRILLERVEAHSEGEAAQIEVADLAQAALGKHLRRVPRDWAPVRSAQVKDRLEACGLAAKSGRRRRA